MAQVMPSGGEGRLLHKFKTTRKSNTRDPTWNEAFVFDPAVPISQLKLRLTVWDHDLGGIGNDWWGQTELGLEDEALRGTRQAKPLQPLLGRNGRVKKTAEGTISFALKARDVNNGDTRQNIMRARLQSVVQFAA